MTAAREDSPVVRSILAGERPELKRLAAEGLAPIALEELLDLQVRLTEDEDPEIARLARSALAEAEPRILAHGVEERGGERLAAYLARHAESPEVLRAVVGRRGLDPSILEVAAARVPPDLQEQLLLRQDAIVERPEILDALEANPRLSDYARRRIAEYRRHLTAPGDVEPAAAEAPEAEPASGLSEEEATEVRTIRKIFEEASRGEFGDLPEDVARLTEAQIRRLPATARVELCRRAPKTLRMILIRDQHPEVAKAVMKLNRLTDDEVDQIVKSRTVIVDVLEAIAVDRTWSRRYPVVHSLVCNPKTPLQAAMRFLPRLTVRHLRDVIRDRNLPEAVRERAKQLYTIKVR